MSLPFVACASITSISAIISFGFSIAASRNETGAARTMALYACARSVALAIVSFGPFLTESLPWLEAIASAMVLVHAIDAWICTTIKDPMKTFGPAGTAALNLAELLWAIHA